MDASATVLHLCEAQQLRMEDRTRYKYAIVRVKESSVVEFFTLIASQGYSDVSFVSNLSQAIARPDPNDDIENGNGVAESEDRCSASGTPQTPSEDARISSHLTNHLALMCNAVIKDDSSPTLNGNDVSLTSETGATSPTNSLRDLEDIAAAASSDLISNLFATHPMPFKEWEPTTTPNKPPSSRAAQFKQTPGPLQFQTRMKGWQREYIKDVINNGHYPTEEELRDIEQKCDLSRKQVLRFIAKRLVNPNRKPRADWRTDKAADTASVTPPKMVSVKTEDA